MARMRKNRGGKGPIVIGVIILLLVGGAYLVYRAPSSSPKTPTHTNPSPAGIQTSTQTISETDAKGTYTVAVKYPVISGIASSRVESRINADVKAEAQKLIANFKTNLLDLNPDVPIDAPSSLSTDPTLRAPVHGIVGVTFEVSEYERGAAHPANYMVTDNYAMATGAKVSLKDLFPNKPDYLNLISAAATPLIDAKMKEAGLTEWFHEGAAPVAENYGNYYLTDSALVIVFDPAQVGPSVIGIVEIPIPFAAFGTAITFPA